MSFETGLYEQLINKLVTNKLDSLDCQKFHISETPLDKEEASQYLSLYLATLVSMADTLEQAINDERISGDMRDFCDYFAEKMEIKGE